MFFCLYDGYIWVIILNLQIMVFELLKLLYVYDVLEFYIDVCIMEIYYSKYYQVYVMNLNKVIEGIDFEGKLLEEVIKLGKDKLVIWNNGGGYWNYMFFWELLKKNENGMFFGELVQVINDVFGIFEVFKEKFVVVVII